MTLVEIFCCCSSSVLLHAVTLYWIDTRWSINISISTCLLHSHWQIELLLVIALMVLLLQMTQCMVITFSRQFCPHTSQWEFCYWLNESQNWNLTYLSHMVKKSFGCRAVLNQTFTYLPVWLMKELLDQTESLTVLKNWMLFLLS